MDETVEPAELPLDDAGTRLVRARETAGLSRTQVAGITKIPERHLAAIEQGDFAALPARTYAMGFSRSYARAVGEDEAEIAALVRAELAATRAASAPRGAPAFEPGDPARVPSSRFAWLSALAAVVVIVAGLALWRGYYAPGGELPSILPSDAPTEAVSAAPAALPAAGPVVFTALAPKVWVKFTDGNGVQLFQKELAQGESYTVPADQPQVLLRTVRPDALAITIGGRPAARISEVQQAVSDVPVTAAALLARGAAAASPAPAVTPGASSDRSRPRPPSRGSAVPGPTASATIPPPPQSILPSPSATASPTAAD